LRDTDRAAEGLGIIYITQQSIIHFKAVVLPLFTLWVSVRSFALLVQQWGQEGSAVSLCTPLCSFLWSGMDVFTTGLVFEAWP